MQKIVLKSKKTDQRIFSLGDTYRYLKMYDSAYFLPKPSLPVT